MSLFERAWLYITRKKGRTFILFCIFFVMATAIISGISIKKATQSSMQQARESVGGYFSLNINYDENNPNIKREEKKSQFGTGIQMENTGVPLSEEILHEVSKVQGIKDYNASTMLSLDDSGLEYIKPEQQENMFQVGGTGVDLPNIQLHINLNSKLAQQFQSGQMKLVEGDFIKDDGVQQIMVHRKFADINQLHVGDKMTLKAKEHEHQAEVEIVGIFDDNKKSEEEDFMSFLMSENQIISDVETGKLLQGNEVVDFETAKFYVKDPKEMMKIVDDVKALDLDWQQFAIDANDMQYQQIAGSIESVDQMITMMLYATLLVSCIILTLILSLWIKGRIHETGILLSFGIPKVKIIGQYIVELFMISILAFGLSFLSGKAISQSIGNSLMNSTLHSKQNQISQVTTISSISLEGLNDTEIQELDVSITLNELCTVYLIGSALIMISVVLSSVSLLRLKPKEILSKMS